jgi:hypothetical protein
MFIYRYLYAYVRVPGLVPCALWFYRPTGTYTIQVYVNVCTVPPGTNVFDLDEQLQYCTMYHTPSSFVRSA